MRWSKRRGFVCAVSLVLVSMLSSTASAQDTRPTMAEFMGLCAHTVLFEAEAYTTVTRHVRDYHGANWDLGEDPSTLPAWPFAENRVNWDRIYGGWTALGYDVLVSLMFTELPPERWSNLPEQAQAYGESFAAYFGPGGQGTVPTVQIGNEPTNWDDAQFRTLFEHTARGVRAGDPAMRIATCAAHAAPSDTYSKGLDAVFADIGDLYDIITVNAYAFVEGWPTWRRSFPEDPTIDFLTRLQAIIDWRDANAPGKEVWVTEFGWDSSTQEPDPNGDFAQWEDVSDPVQALYIVRAWLVMSAMDLDRAYLYWFDDDDTPQLHGASGLTRNGTPKPSFHATAHLFRTLGDLRLSRVIEQTPGEAYVYAYADPANADREVWVAWSPTGEERQVPFTLALDGWQVDRAEKMPLSPAPAAVEVEMIDGAARFLLGEAPTYLWLNRTAPPVDAGVPAGDAAAAAADASLPGTSDPAPMGGAQAPPPAATDAGGPMMAVANTGDSDDSGCSATDASTPGWLLIGGLALAVRRRERKG